MNDWPDIIWREWRHTSDEAYSRHLFELVADRPVGRIAYLVEGLLGAFYGGLVGLLIGLVSPLSISAALLLGLAAGSAARLLLIRRQNWRRWLAGLTLHASPETISLVGIGMIFVTCGGLTAWLLSWIVGLGASAMIGMMALVLILIQGVSAGLVGWLIGLEREPNPAYLHRFRWAWFWWRGGRPLRAELRTALPQAGSDLLADEPAAPPAERVKGLSSTDWRERFRAEYGLIELGGEAVPILETAVRENALRRSVALRLAQTIGGETTRQLGAQAHWLLCPDCLVRFGRHQIEFMAEPILYYGCRICRQSRRYWPGKVTAVLDEGMAETVETDQDIIRVNWLKHRALFDFDRVEIIRATDEDVERFAVQVGNDTDPLRRARYSHMSCLVQDRLSKNSLRILRSRFGSIQLG